MTFEQLYETYFADVFRFAMWLTHDQSEAEDAASETFVRAWVRRDRLRTETLKAYLLVITRNIFLKSRSTSHNHEQLPDELPDGAPDPQRHASARMDLSRVSEALMRLPETDRLALVLRTEQSLTYAEIGRVLEISEGAARVKVYRARRRLLSETITRNGGTS